LSFEASVDRDEIGTGTVRTPLLLLTASVALTAGCVAEPLAVEAPDGADVAVVADDMLFEPGRIEVVTGEPTVLHLRNDGGVVHDLVLPSGWESGEVRPGEAVTVTMDPLDTSTVGWCSVPGHRDAGMELEIVVGGDA
jgi:nitrite reductase (NO-forming)